MEHNASKPAAPAAGERAAAVRADTSLPPPAAQGAVDAHPPREIAQAAEALGVAKAGMALLPLVTLSVLAGAFISLGALFYLVAISQSALGWGPTRVLGGACFSLGLVLVVVAGAELFTGNNLIAMAWASTRVRTGAVLRNWVIVFIGNAVGCLGCAALAVLAGLDGLGDGALRQTALQVAATKLALPAEAAFARGVLCNALVCLAVWLTLGGRSVTDKILAIVLPITAFVALGLEHSIANLFFLPYAAWLAQGTGAAVATGALLQNLLWVTLGNVAGGTVLVAGVYWLAYRPVHDPARR